MGATDNLGRAVLLSSWEINMTASSHDDCYDRGNEAAIKKKKKADNSLSLTACIIKYATERNT